MRRGGAAGEGVEEEGVCVVVFSNGDAAQLAPFERKLSGLTRANTEGFETGFVR